MLLPSNVDWATAAEAARQLGVKPHEVYHAVNRGQLPAVRLGKNLLVDLDEAREALKTKTK